MAIEKKPSIYSDRSSIGSAEELDEYGVWVKSGPQILSSINSDIQKSGDISLASENDMPEISASEDFLDDDASDTSIDDDFTINDDSDSFTSDDFTDDEIPSDTSEPQAQLPADDDSSGNMSAFDDFDLPDEDDEKPDVIDDVIDNIEDAAEDDDDDIFIDMDDIEDSNNEIKEDLSSVLTAQLPVQDLETSESSETDNQETDDDSEINTDSDDSLGDLSFLEDDDAVIDENTGITADNEDISIETFDLENDDFDESLNDDSSEASSVDDESSYEVPTVQAISEGKTGKNITEHIETNIVNIQENYEKIVNFKESEPPKREDDLSTQLLLKIANELSSIRNELSDLKKEFSIVRSSAPPEQYETKKEEPQAYEHSGFFAEEEDETIALTGDELDNILNTADFTEESGANETPEIEFSADTSEPLADISSPEPQLDDLSISSLDMDEISIDTAPQSIPSEQDSRSSETIETITKTEELEIETVEFDSIDDLNSGTEDSGFDEIVSISDDFDNEIPADAQLSDLEYDDNFSADNTELPVSEESEESAESAEPAEAADEVIEELTIEDELTDIDDSEIDLDSVAPLNEETLVETDELNADISQSVFSDDIEFSESMEEIQIDEAMYLDEDETDKSDEIDEIVEIDFSALDDDNADIDADTDEIDEIVDIDLGAFDLGDNFDIELSADETEVCAIPQAELPAKLPAVSPAKLPAVSPAKLPADEIDENINIDASAADISDNADIETGTELPAVSLAKLPAEEISEDIDISDFDLGDNFDIEISSEEIEVSIDEIDESAGIAASAIPQAEILAVSPADEIDEDINIDESKDSDELKALREEGAQPVTDAPENSSYLEEEDTSGSFGFVADELDSDSIDLSDAIIDEPVLSTDGIDEPVTEPEIDLDSIEDIGSLDDFSDITIEEEQILAEADADLSTDIPADEDLSADSSLDAAEEVTFEEITEEITEENFNMDLSADDNLDIDLSEADDSIIDEDSDDDLDIDIPADDMFISDIQESPQSESSAQDNSYADDSFEQLIPEGFETEIEETPVPFDDIPEEEITSDNIDELPDITNDTLSYANEPETPQSAIEEIPPDTGSSAVNTGIQEAKIDNYQNIPKELKTELRNILSYMDQLLDSLPEQKIEEFARSEYFDSYKKLFKELGLV